jgi:hypothetical protein
MSSEFFIFFQRFLRTSKEPFLQIACVKVSVAGTLCRSAANAGANCRLHAISLQAAVSAHQLIGYGRGLMNHYKGVERELPRNNRPEKRNKKEKIK